MNPDAIRAAFPLVEISSVEGVFVATAGDGQSVHTFDSDEEHEATMPGIREGHLAELFTQAGLTPEETTLSVEAHFESFDDWWIPYTKGVGPAGEYVKKLDDAGRERLREAAAGIVPDGPFDLPAQAWCVSARV